MKEQKEEIIKVDPEIIIKNKENYIQMINEMETLVFFSYKNIK